ncbi:MAG: hypothetical protein WDW36_001419 [Sanguina aurantia]
MRQQYRPQQGSRGVSRSFLTLLAIVFFSVSLLGGYLLLGHPGVGSIGRVTVPTSSVPTPPSPPLPVVALGSSSSSSRNTSTGSGADAAANKLVSGDVSGSDERHRDNEAEIIAGQSSKDEHLADTITLLKQQNNAQHEAEAAKQDTTSTTANAATSSTELLQSAAVTGVNATSDAAAAAATIAAATTAAATQLPATVANATARAAAELLGQKVAVAAVKKPAAAAVAAGSNPGPEADMLHQQAAVDANASATAVAASVAAIHELAAAGVGEASNGVVAVTAKPAAAVAAAEVAVAAAGQLAAAASRPEGHTVHTLFTSNGSPYQNFQARIMVATYNIVRVQPGGEHLVAMTRILHRVTPDEVMDEIPTFRAQPLQPDCDKWCWFPVADRANAVQQWIDAAGRDMSMVKGAWLLLLETDYVWIKPLPSPGNAWDSSVPGWSFAFDYIGPKHPVVREILAEKCPTCDPDTVPNSGPAPVLLRFNDLKLATPMWEDLTKWIETHEEQKKQLGWVREMYAWDIAVAANKLNLLNVGPPRSPLIAQPPHDTATGNASMYHYTWGAIFKEGGREVWKFDKRFYTAADDALKIPLIPLPEPWHEGVLLHDGNIITKQLQETLVDMVTRMNAGIATLPDLRPGHQVVVAAATEAAVTAVV